MHVQLFVMLCHFTCVCKSDFVEWICMKLCHPILIWVQIGWHGLYLSEDRTLIGREILGFQVSKYI